MATQHNDIRSSIGEYPTIADVRDKDKFDAWLAPRVGPYMRHLCCQYNCELASNWVPKPSWPEALAQAEAIVGYAFDLGLRKAFQDETTDDFDSFYDEAVHEPGSANVQIAEVIRDLVTDVCPGAWIGVQAEIASALGDLGCPVPRHRVATPRHDEYLSSVGVAKYLAQAGLQRFSSVIVVAHGDHVRRCVGATRRATMDARAAERNWSDPPALLVPDLSSIEYPTEGHQIWVSGAGLPGRGGPEDYRPHDVAGRVRALASGWLDWDDILTERFE